MASLQFRLVFSVSVNGTSLMPMLRLPWQTPLRPDPEPPADTVIWTSLLAIWKFLAAWSTRGCRADEPAMVSLPLNPEVAVGIALAVPPAGAVVAPAAGAVVAAAAGAVVGLAAAAAVGAAVGAATGGWFQAKDAKTRKERKR